MTDIPAALCDKPVGSRKRATVRFLIALVASGLLARALYFLLPRHLSGKVDVVGYSVFRAYAADRLFHEYYLIVIFFPLCALVAYVILGRLIPRASWPAASSASEPKDERRRSDSTALDRPLFVLRWSVGLAVALFPMALATEIVLSTRGWSLPASAIYWMLLALAIAASASIALAAIIMRSRRRFESVTTAVVGAVACLAPLTLSAVSSVTGITSSTGTRSLPWFPWPLGFLFAVSLLIALAVAHFRARLRGTTSVFGPLLIYVAAVPAILVLRTANVPSPIAGFDDMFHSGELLGGAHLLLDHGAVPWRDFTFIHGLFHDVLAPALGLWLFDNSAWGVSAVTSVIVIPFALVVQYWLFVYLYGQRPLPVLASVLAVWILGIYHWRFVLLSPVYMLLGLLIQRATVRRAFAFVWVLGIANVLVPEMAYGVVASGAIILAYEARHYDRHLKWTINFRRALLCLLAGGFFLALLAAVLLAKGSLSAFVDYYVTFGPGHRMAGTHPIDSGNLKDPSFVFAALAPIAVVLGAFYYAIAGWRLRRTLSPADWVMLAASLFTLLYYEKFLGRPDGHVYHSTAVAIPPLFYFVDKLLLLAQKAMSRYGRILGQAPYTVAIALLAVFAVPSAMADFAQGSRRFAISAPDTQRTEGFGYVSPQMAIETRRIDGIRDLIDTYATQEDHFFDFSDSPALFGFVIDTKPASRFYHVSMALRRRSQVQLIHDLQGSTPKLVAFHSDAFGLGAWDGVPRQVRHYEIASYILRHYRPVAEIEKTMFYLRNDIAARPLSHPRGAIAFEGTAGYERGDACDWGFTPNYVDTLDGPSVEVAYTSKTSNSPILHASGWAMEAGRHALPAELLILLNDRLVARHAFSGEVPAGGAYPQDYRLRIPITGGVLNAPEVRVLAVTKNSVAGELNFGKVIGVKAAHSPDQLLVDGTAIRVAPGAVEGWADVIQLEPAQEVLSIRLPSGTQPSDFAGIELVARRWGDDGFEVLDHDPVTTKEINSSRSILFRTSRRTAGPLRVRFDNCQQYFTFAGTTLYMRYGKPLEIERVALVPSRP